MPLDCTVPGGERQKDDSSWGWIAAGVIGVSAFVWWGSRAMSKGK